MTKLQTAILISLGLIAVLAAIVGAVLRHHIGGFLRTVEREAEEAREREEAETTQRAAEAENNHHDTGV